MVHIVRAAQAGDFDQVERLAVAISGLHRKAHAVATLAQNMAEAGDVDRAQALTEWIATQSERDDALVALVPAVAAAGAFDRAESLARSIGLRLQAGQSIGRRGISAQRGR